MEFAGMNERQFKDVLDALDEMEVDYFVNPMRRKIQVDGKVFTDQEALDDHLIFNHS